MRVERWEQQCRHRCVMSFITSVFPQNAVEKGIISQWNDFTVLMLTPLEVPCSGSDVSCKLLIVSTVSGFWDAFPKESSEPTNNPWLLYIVSNPRTDLMLSRPFSDLQWQLLYMVFQYTISDHILPTEWQSKRGCLVTVTLDTVFMPDLHPKWWRDTLHVWVGGILDFFPDHSKAISSWISTQNKKAVPYFNNSGIVQHLAVFALGREIGSSNATSSILSLWKI